MLISVNCANKIHYNNLCIKFSTWKVRGLSQSHSRVAPNMKFLAGLGEKTTELSQIETGIPNWFRHQTFYVGSALKSFASEPGKRVSALYYFNFSMLHLPQCPRKWRGQTFLKLLRETMSDLFWAKFFSKQTTVIKFFPFVSNVNIEKFTLIVASWVIRTRWQEIRRFVLEFKAS